MIHTLEVPPPFFWPFGTAKGPRIRTGSLSHRTPHTTPSPSLVSSILPSYIFSPFHFPSLEPHLPHSIDTLVALDYHVPSPRLPLPTEHTARILRHCLPQPSSSPRVVRKFEPPLPASEHKYTISLPTPVDTFTSSILPLHRDSPPTLPPLRNVYYSSSPVFIQAQQAFSGRLLSVSS